MPSILSNLLACLFLSLNVVGVFSVDPLSLHPLSPWVAGQTHVISWTTHNLNALATLSWRARGEVVSHPIASRVSGNQYSMVFPSDKVQAEEALTIDVSIQMSTLARTFSSTVTVTVYPSVSLTINYPLVNKSWFVGSEGIFAWTTSSTKYKKVGLTMFRVANGKEIKEAGAVVTDSSFIWDVPADLTTGMYVATLSILVPGGNIFSVRTTPFLVRPVPSMGLRIVSGRQSASSSQYQGASSFAPELALLVGSSVSFFWTCSDGEAVPSIHFQDVIRGGEAFPALALPPGASSTTTWTVPAPQFVGSSASASFRLVVHPVGHPRLRISLDVAIGQPPALTLTNPAQHSTVTPGSQVAVRWTSQSVASDQSVRLTCTAPDGQVVLDTLVANSGQYSWWVPTMCGQQACLNGEHILRVSYGGRAVVSSVSLTVQAAGTSQVTFQDDLWGGAVSPSKWAHSSSSFSDVCASGEPLVLASRVPVVPPVGGQGMLLSPAEAAVTAMLPVGANQQVDVWLLTPACMRHPGSLLQVHVRPFQASQSSSSPQGWRLLGTSPALQDKALNVFSLRLPDSAVPLQLRFSDGTLPQPGSSSASYGAPHFAVASVRITSSPSVVVSPSLLLLSDFSAVAPATTVTVAWSTAGNVGKVSVELLRNGASVSQLATDVVNSGRLSWAVPATLSPGSDYSLRVTSSDRSSVTTTSATFAVTVAVPLQALRFSVQSPSGSAPFLEVTLSGPAAEGALPWWPACAQLFSGSGDTLQRAMPTGCSFVKAKNVLRVFLSDAAPLASVSSLETSGSAFTLAQAVVFQGSTSSLFMLTGTARRDVPPPPAAVTVLSASLHETASLVLLQLDAWPLPMSSPKLNVNCSELLARATQRLYAPRACQVVLAPTAADSNSQRVWRPSLLLHITNAVSASAFAASPPVFTGQALLVAGSLVAVTGQPTLVQGPLALPGGALLHPVLQGNSLSVEVSGAGWSQLPATSYPVDCALLFPASTVLRAMTSPQGTPSCAVQALLDGKTQLTVSLPNGHKVAPGLQLPFPATTLVLSCGCSLPRVVRLAPRGNVLPVPPAEKLLLVPMNAQIVCNYGADCVVDVALNASTQLQLVPGLNCSAVTPLSALGNGCCCYMSEKNGAYFLRLHLGPGSPLQAGAGGKLHLQDSFVSSDPALRNADIQLRGEVTVGGPAPVRMAAGDGTRLSSATSCGASLQFFVPLTPIQRVPQTWPAPLLRRTTSDCSRLLRNDTLAALRGALSPAAGAGVQCVVSSGWLAVTASGVLPAALPQLEAMTQLNLAVGQVATTVGLPQPGTFYPWFADSPVVLGSSAVSVAPHAVERVQLTFQPQATLRGSAVAELSAPLSGDAGTPNSVLQLEGPICCASVLSAATVAAIPGARCSLHLKSPPQALGGGVIRKLDKTVLLRVDGSAAGVPLPSLLVPSGRQVVLSTSVNHLLLSYGWAVTFSGTGSRLPPLPPALPLALLPARPVDSRLSRSGAGTTFLLPFATSAPPVAGITNCDKQVAVTTSSATASASPASSNCVVTGEGVRLHCFGACTGVDFTFSSTPIALQLNNGSSDWFTLSGPSAAVLVRALALTSLGTPALEPSSDWGDTSFTLRVALRMSSNTSSTPTSSGPSKASVPLLASSVPCDAVFHSSSLGMLGSNPRCVVSTFPAPTLPPAWATALDSAPVLAVLEVFNTRLGCLKTGATLQLLGSPLRLQPYVEVSFEGAVALPALAPVAPLAASMSASPLPQGALLLQLQLKGGDACLPWKLVLQADGGRADVTPLQKALDAGLPSGHNLRLGAALLPATPVTLRLMASRGRAPAAVTTVELRRPVPTQAPLLQHKTVRINATGVPGRRLLPLQVEATLPRGARPGSLRYRWTLLSGPAGSPLGAQAAASHGWAMVVPAQSVPYGLHQLRVDVWAGEVATPEGTASCMFVIENLEQAPMAMLQLDAGRPLTGQIVTDARPALRLRCALFDESNDAILDAGTFRWAVARREGCDAQGQNCLDTLAPSLATNVKEVVAGSRTNMLTLKDRQLDVLSSMGRSSSTAAAVSQPGTYSLYTFTCSWRNPMDNGAGSSGVQAAGQLLVPERPVAASLSSRLMTPTSPPLDASFRVLGYESVQDGVFNVKCSCSLAPVWVTLAQLSGVPVGSSCHWAMDQTPLEQLYYRARNSSTLSPDGSRTKHRLQLSTAGLKIGVAHRVSLVCVPAVGGQVSVYTETMRVLPRPVMTAPLVLAAQSAANDSRVPTTLVGTQTRTQPAASAAFVEGALFSLSSAWEAPETDPSQLEYTYLAEVSGSSNAEPIILAQGFGSGFVGGVRLPAGLSASGCVVEVFLRVCGCRCGCADSRNFFQGAVKLRVCPAVVTTDPETLLQEGVQALLQEKLTLTGGAAPAALLLVERTLTMAEPICTLAQRLAPAACRNSVACSSCSKLGRAALGLLLATAPLCRKEACTAGALLTSQAARLMRTAPGGMLQVLGRQLHPLLASLQEENECLPVAAATEVLGAVAALSDACAHEEKGHHCSQQQLSAGTAAVEESMLMQCSPSRLGGSSLPFPQRAFGWSSELSTGLFQDAAEGGLQARLGGVRLPHQALEATVVGWEGGKPDGAAAMRLLVTRKPLGPLLPMLWNASDASRPAAREGNQGWGAETDYLSLSGALFSDRACAAPIVEVQDPDTHPGGPSMMHVKVSGGGGVLSEAEEALSGELGFSVPAYLGKDRQHLRPLATLPLRNLSCAAGFEFELSRTPQESLPAANISELARTMNCTDPASCPRMLQFRKVGHFGLGEAPSSVFFDVPGTGPLPKSISLMLAPHDWRRPMSVAHVKTGDGYQMQLLVNAGLDEQGSFVSRPRQLLWWRGPKNGWRCAVSLELPWAPPGTPFVITVGFQSRQDCWGLVFFNGVEMNTTVSTCLGGGCQPPDNLDPVSPVQLSVGSALSSLATCGAGDTSRDVLPFQGMIGRLALHSPCLCLSEAVNVMRNMVEHQQVRLSSVATAQEFDYDFGEKSCPADGGHGSPRVCNEYNPEVPCGVALGGDANLGPASVAWSPFWGRTLRCASVGRDGKLAGMGAEVVSVTPTGLRCRAFDGSAFVISAEPPPEVVCTVDCVVASTRCPARVVALPLASGNVKLSWDLAGLTKCVQAPLEAVEVTLLRESDGKVVGVRHAPPGSLSMEVKSLTAGVTYSFSVRLLSANGPGPSSKQVVFTPLPCSLDPIVCAGGTIDHSGERGAVASSTSPSPAQDSGAPSPLYLIVTLSGSSVAELVAALAPGSSTAVAGYLALEAAMETALGSSASVTVTGEYSCPGDSRCPAPGSNAAGRRLSSTLTSFVLLCRVTVPSSSLEQRLQTRLLDAALPSSLRAELATALQPIFGNNPVALTPAVVRTATPQAGDGLDGPPSSGDSLVGPMQKYDAKVMVAVGGAALIGVAFLATATFLRRRHSAQKNKVMSLGPDGDKLQAGSLASVMPFNDGSKDLDSEVRGASAVSPVSPTHASFPPVMAELEGSYVENSLQLEQLSKLKQLVERKESEQDLAWLSERKESCGSPIYPLPGVLPGMAVRPAAAAADVMTPQSPLAVHTQEGGIHDDEALARALQAQFEAEAAELKAMRELQRRVDDQAAAASSPAVVVSPSMNRVRPMALPRPAFSPTSSSAKVVPAVAPAPAAAALPADEQAELDDLWDAIAVPPTTE